MGGQFFVIQLKRGSLDSWDVSDYIAPVGQPILAETYAAYGPNQQHYHRLKIGNGVDTWTSLPYASPNPLMYTDSGVNMDFAQDTTFKIDRPEYTIDFDHDSVYAIKNTITPTLGISTNPWDSLHLSNSIYFSNADNYNSSISLIENYLHINPLDIDVSEVNVRIAGNQIQFQLPTTNLWNGNYSKLQMIRGIASEPSAILDSGYCFVRLFDGNFGPDSGTVNIPGISNYSLFYIRASNRYSCFIASLYDTYIRGISGYCSGSNIWVNTLGLTIDPATDNVTYIASGAAYIKKSGATVSTDQINDSIAEIYGILPKSEQAL